MKAAAALLVTVLLAGCAGSTAGQAPAQSVMVQPGATTPDATSPPPSSMPSSMPPSSAPMSMTPSPSAVAVVPGEPWILYQWMAGGGDGLYLVRPDGTAGHRILADLPPQVYHPEWSPDGKVIAFALGQDNGEIWTANADGTDAKKLVGCDKAPCQWVDSVAWSPDGTKLAYVRFDDPAVKGKIGSRASIEVFDIATGKRRIVARPPADGTEHNEYILPRWSPDGRQLVFAMTHEPVPPTGPLLGSSIAVASADGSEVDSVRNLTDPALFGGYPDWSPDGKHIVFTTYDQAYFEQGTQPANLYTVGPDGTGLTQLTHFGEKDTRATQPTWTPDGKQIIFCHITYDPTGKFGGWGVRHIAFVNADGTGLTVLDGQYATHPRLRPAP